MNPSRVLTGIVLAVATAALQASSQTTYQTDFSDGIQQWKTYHRQAITAELEAVPEEGRNNSGLLRVTCPGKNSLEGAGVTVNVSPWTLYETSVTLRGQGEAWLCLNSANGWLYSRTTQALSGSWDTLTMQKLTGAGDTRMSVFVLTKSPQEAVFELDAVTITAKPAPVSADVPVQTVRFEAEDLVNVAGNVVDADGAHAGKAVSLPTYGRLTGIPFPLASKSVKVWIRVRPGTPEDVFRLKADIGGYSHIMASARPDPARTWQWLAFQADQPAAARGSVSIALRQDKRGVPKAMVDTVVIGPEQVPEDNSLDRMLSLAEARPMVAAGRAAQPPVIDGDTGDSCWQQAVSIRDFVTNAGGQPPAQTTTAKICHDEEALYILFRCREYVLQPAANQRHEFKHSHTEADSPVWKDDSVVVLLGPPTGPHVYDIFCNAVGTVADARCQPPDLWSSRDPQWNGNVQAAGRIEAGVWTLEMAIPYKPMQADGTTSEKSWRIGLGRIAQHASETTSWHPVKRGFHEYGSLARLALTERAPAVDLGIPAKLSSGRAAVSCGNADASLPVLASLGLEAPASPASTVTRLVPAGADVQLPFTVSREGRMVISAAILDANSLQPYYLPPKQVRMAKASECRIQLQTSGPYRVFLNGAIVASGNSADGQKPITVPLQTGVNAFAISTESGKAAASLELPGQVVTTDGQWRMQTQPAKQFGDSDFDDSHWEMADVIGPADDPLSRHGALVIGGGEPCVLRRTVLFEHTYVWPMPQPALFVPENAAQHITFSTTGLPGRTLAGYRLHLLTPADFEVTGATGYYGRTRPEKASFSLAPMPSPEDRGNARRHTVISASNPLPYRPKVRILELLNVYVRFTGDAAPADPVTFTYWTEAEDGSVSECPQSFPVKVSPPLRGGQPRSMVWQLWGSFFGPMDDPDMKRAALKTAAMAGFNNIVSGTAEDTEIGEALGFENTMGINFEPWSLGRLDYLQKHPDAALIDADGEPSEKYVCTTELFGEGWQDVAEQLERKIQTSRPHVVDWDYESSPFNSYLACYCSRCLDAFRNHSGLNPGNTLDPTIIRDEYPEQWIDFLTSRNAELARRFKEVSNAHNAHFSMYSGYHSPETQRTYGVDWAKIGDRQAADHVGCGYGRKPDLVQATIEALDGIPLVLGVLMRPYDRSLREPVLPLTKAKVLRRQADSTGGILVYDRLPLGGRSWLALAEISRLVTRYEDVFLNGKDALDRVIIEPFAEPEVAAKADAHTLIVMLMNTGQKKKQFSVTAKSGPGNQARAFFGERIGTLGGKGLSLTLAPGDAEAIIVDMTP